MCNVIKILVASFLCILVMETGAEVDPSMCIGKEPGNYPHPDFCSKMVVCRDEEPHEGDCPDGMIFDPESTAECVNGECTDEPASTTAAPATTTEAPTPTTEAPSPTTEAPSPTTEAPTPTTEAPAPTTEAPVETTEAPTPTSEATAPTTPEETTPVPTTTEETTPSNPGDDDFMCPPDLPQNEAVFVPSAQNCEQYYLCFSDMPFLLHCRSGLHFNNATHQCDYPVNANCEITNPDGLPECTEDRIIYYLPHPKDCQLYLLCIGGDRKIGQCPLNQFWDYSRETCVHLREVQCFGPN